MALHTSRHAPASTLQALAPPDHSHHPTDDSEPTGAPGDFGLPSRSADVQKRCWDRQEVWLRTYSALGQKQATSKATGISIWAVQKWEQGNLYSFNDRFQLAHAQYVEAWERDIIDARIRNPQGNRGSDILVMFRTKKLDPSYREDIKVSVDTSLKDHIQALKALAQLANTPLPVAEAQVRELPPGT